MKAYDCHVCGAPGVLYKKHGKLVQRPWCAQHWRDYMASYRQKERSTAAIPDGWKIIRSHWMKPPAGITRIVIDGFHRRVTVYVEDRCKTVHFSDLKPLNSPQKLLAFYRSRAYQTTTEKKRWWVLEKAA